jgi:FlaA1/EpsC-like NDP-sugar epimerase
MLIFGVLYALAALSSRLALMPDAHPALLALPTGLLFSGVLLATQWTNPGDQASVLREVVVFAFLSLVVGVLCFFGIWLVLSRPNHPGALLALEGAVAVPLAVAAWRWLSLRFDVLNVTRERVLIVGTGETARQVCRWIVSNHSHEYGVIGFADEEDSRDGAVLAMGVRVQTDYESLADFAYTRCDRLIVALDEKRGRLPVRQLVELRLMGVEIEEATSFFERFSGKIPVDTMLPSWLIF